MLTFLRTYQKTFMIVVTFAVVVSFLFFGISGVGSGAVDKVAEVPLCKALDGSTITKQKVERMARFLSCSSLDISDDQVASPNCLNDGVLEKNFMQTALGVFLAERIFPEIQDEIAGAVQSIKSFKTYQHPHTPFLTAGGLWSQFVPESMRTFSDLVRLNGTTPYTFSLLSQLYLQHKAVPLSFLKRMIAYQQGQDPNIQQDDQLAYADFSLAGLHSGKEWFGGTYLNAAAQVIINGAAQAKLLGYSVSTADARAQLMANVAQAAKRGGEEIEQQKLFSAFIYQVRKEGMDEGECLDLWKDIMLFRKLMQVAAEAVVVPDELIQNAYERTKDLAEIEVFSLPKDLKFKDFTSLLKLWLYVDAVSSKPHKEKFSLPKEFLSVFEIEKKMPGLVRREFVLEYKKVDVKKIAGQVGLKELWNWQTEDMGWSLLQKNYTFLSEKQALSKEARLAALEELEEDQRLEVDQFSRRKVLSSDKERLLKVFSTLPEQKGTFLIGKKGEGLPFKEIDQKEKIRTFLEVAAPKDEIPSDPMALEARDRLAFYTEDEQMYYSIAVVEKASVRRALTFAEAEACGILRHELDKKLERAYTTVRKKDPEFYQNDGSWKPLAEVKDRVGMDLFNEFCGAILSDYEIFSGKAPTIEQKESPLFYVQNWMLGVAQETLEKAKSGVGQDPDRPLWVKQWDFVSEVTTVARNSTDFFGEQEEFFLAQGEFSAIHPSIARPGLFFKIISRSQRDTVPDEEMKALKAPLLKDAEKQAIQDLWGKIDAKHALKLQRSV